jgi:hypothetical protein
LITTEEKQKILNSRLAEKTKKLFLSIDPLEFYVYYSNHSIPETCKNFGLSTSNQLYTYCKYFNIKKSQEAVKQSKRASTVRTCLARYGVVNGGASKEAQQKIKETTRAHYGVDCYFQTKQFIEYNRQHQIDTYGGVGFASDELTEKQKQTMLEKYCVESPMHSTELKERLDKHMLEKYGVKRYAQTRAFHQKARKRYCYNSSVFFDSSWELALWVYATDHNEPIERCPAQFEYEREGKIYSYTPDFLYKGAYIEVKGDNWFDENGVMICPTDRSKDEHFTAKQECGIRNNVIFYKKLK